MPGPVDFASSVLPATDRETRTKYKYIRTEWENHSSSFILHSFIFINAFHASQALFHFYLISRLLSVSLSLSLSLSLSRPLIKIHATTLPFSLSLSRLLYPPHHRQSRNLHRTNDRDTFLKRKLSLRRWGGQETYLLSGSIIYKGSRTRLRRAFLDLWKVSTLGKRDLAHSDEMQIFVSQK